MGTHRQMGLKVFFAFHCLSKMDEVGPYLYFFILTMGKENMYKITMCFL